MKRSKIRFWKRGELDSKLKVLISHQRSELQTPGKTNFINSNQEPKCNSKTQKGIARTSSNHIFMMYSVQNSHSYSTQNHSVRYNSFSSLPWTFLLFFYWLISLREEFKHNDFTLLYQTPNIIPKFRFFQQTLVSGSCQARVLRNQAVLKRVKISEHVIERCKNVNRN